MTPTPETLRALVAKQTYGEPDGPPLRAGLNAHADAWEAQIAASQEKVRGLREDIAYILAWSGQSQSALTSRQVADAVMGMCQAVLRVLEPPE